MLIYKFCYENQISFSKNKSILKDVVNDFSRTILVSKVLNLTNMEIVDT